MTNFEHHIKKATNDVILTHAEKARMRTVLRSYMRFKPAPAPTTTYTRGIGWLIYLHRPLAAALILVLVSTSGITYAAESSLPGDALYAVKVHINEPVKVALATNAEAKAEVQIELAERRIEEASALAAEKRLDADTQHRLAAAFEEHAETAVREVEKIDEKDASAAVELSSRFETRLAAHDEVFAITQEDENDAEEPSPLALSIRDAGLRVASIRTRAEERLAVSTSPAPVVATLAMEMSPKAAPAAETAQATASVEAPAPDLRTATRMRAAAEAQLKDAQKKARSNEKKLDAEARVRVYDDLKYAAALIDDGNALLEKHSVALAFHAFQESLVTSERVSVMAKNAVVASKARANRRDISTRTEGRLTETIPTPPASSGKGGIGNAEPEAIEAAFTIEAATPTDAVVTETEADIDTALEATTAPPQFIPPSIQIFTPRWFDNEDEPSNDEEDKQREEKTPSSKDPGGLKLDISL